MTAILDTLTKQQQDIVMLEEALRRRKHNRIDWYYPDTGPLRRELYPKSLEFFAAGATHSERMVMAANRVGKTEGMGGYEMCCHLTGIYPPWWPGRVFKRPVKAWCAGDTSITVRDILQLKILGPWLQFGTGLLRADKIVRHTSKRNVSEAVDQVVVRHITGGLSYLTFKSYDQGRVAFQGTEQDVVWPDEEPPAAIYSEMLTRTMTVGGMIMCTFTPLKGIGDVIMGYIDKDAPKHKFKCSVTWDDVPHLSKRMKDELWASYPPSERDARAKGIPTIGNGRIYPIVLDDILEDDFILPPHYRKAYGMDVGWKKTAALWGAHDADSDIIHFYSEHYKGQAEPSVHASAIKSRGIWIPGAIDPAANGRSQQNGEQLMAVYTNPDHGLDLVNANNAKEAGILETWNRLSTGRIRLFRRSTPNLQQEFPLYHRDEKGMVVMRMNHLMDCYDSETEVLSLGGWERFEKLSGNEPLATVNLQTDEIEYQVPSELVSRPYVGEMIAFGGRKLDALVTPGHRMVVYPQYKTKPVIKLASDLSVWDKIKLRGTWVGKDQGIVSVEGRFGSSHEIDAEVWAEFLGWYVSEGCVATTPQMPGRGYQVSISQTKAGNVAHLRGLLAKTPWTWGYHSGSFHASSKWLWKILRQLGAGCHEKLAPQWVKDASPRLIVAFLRGAIAGDGWRQNGASSYCSVSKRLADDIQELFFKIGRNASVLVGRESGWESVIRGKRVVSTVDQYWVHEWTTPYGHLRDKNNKPNFGRVMYSGMVYCATVPNGTLVVRRNGKLMISGNCMRYYVMTGIEIAKYPPSTQRRRGRGANWRTA